MRVAGGGNISGTTSAGGGVPELQNSEPIWLPGGPSDSVKKSISDLIKGFAANKDCVKAFMEAGLKDPQKVLGGGYVLGDTSSLGALNRNDPGYGITAKDRGVLLKHFDNNHDAAAVTKGFGGGQITIFSENNFTALGKLVDLPSDIGLAMLASTHSAVDYLAFHEFLHAAGADEAKRSSHLDEHFGFEKGTYAKLEKACGLSANDGRVP